MFCSLITPAHQRFTRHVPALTPGGVAKVQTADKMPMASREMLRRSADEIEGRDMSCGALKGLLFTKSCAQQKLTMRFVILRHNHAASKLVSSLVKMIPTA
jgi:hypothetical protein